MRSSLALVVLLLAAGCSTSVVYTTGVPANAVYHPPVYDASLRHASAYAGGYAAATAEYDQRYDAGYYELEPQAAPPAAVPPPVDVRLPFVEAVYVPDAIYAGEQFTIRFEQSALQDPRCLLAPAPLVPAGEVTYLDEQNYDGSMFIMPWRIALPPASVQPQVFAPDLDYNMDVQHPGRYHLQFWGADTRDDGGLAGAQAWKGAFQHYLYPETVQLWSVEFDVLPCRLPPSQAWGGAACGPGGYYNPAYNEQVWVSSPSCPGTAPCFGVNNHPHPAHLVRPTPAPRPRPAPVHQPPPGQPAPPVAPTAAVSKQALPPDQLQVHPTPTSLALPLDQS